MGIYFSLVATQLSFEYLVVNANVALIKRAPSSTQVHSFCPLSPFFINLSNVPLRQLRCISDSLAIHRSPVPVPTVGSAITPRSLWSSNVTPDLLSVSLTLLHQSSLTVAKTAQPSSRWTLHSLPSLSFSLVEITSCYCRSIN